MSSVRVYVFPAEPTDPLKLKNSLVKHRAKALQKELFVRFGLQYRLTGNYRRGFIRLTSKRTNQRSEILFYFCKRNKGIYVQEILLPPFRRRQGIGTFIVNWLKNFAQEFGLRYIVLVSRPEAESFWDKMNFAQISFEEALEKYPWMSSIPTCFQK